MSGLGGLILALVFVDELLLAWAAGDLGWHAGGWVFALCSAAFLIIVWWTFASPKAPYGGPVVRPVVKVVLFVGASIGLWLVGHHVAAVALAVFSLVINALAQTRPATDLLADLADADR